MYRIPIGHVDKTRVEVNSCESLETESMKHWEDFRSISSQVEHRSFTGNSLIEKIHCLQHVPTFQMIAELHPRQNMPSFQQTSDAAIDTIDITKQHFLPS